MTCNYLSQWWPSSLMHICITRSQSVNSIWWYDKTYFPLSLCLFMLFDVALWHYTMPTYTSIPASTWPSLNRVMGTPWHENASCITGPFWGESLISSFPSQRICNAEPFVCFDVSLDKLLINDGLLVIWDAWCICNIIVLQDVSYWLWRCLFHI